MRLSPDNQILIPLDPDIMHLLFANGPG